MPLLSRAIEHDVALSGRKLAKRHVRAHAHSAAHLFHKVPHKRAPHHHSALVDGLALVGHECSAVHGARDTGAATGGTSALAVEGELLGAGAEELATAMRARNRQLSGNVQTWRHMLSAMRAHMAADAREEESQAVQKLARGAERRSHARHRRALVQREGGGNVAHVVDRGLARLSDAPTRVSGKRLQITARPFGIEHAKRKRAFARTRHARDAHKLAERDVHVHVLQIVHARAAHLDMVDILHDFLHLAMRPIV